MAQSCFIREMGAKRQHHQYRLVPDPNAPTFYIGRLSGHGSEALQECLDVVDGFVLGHLYRPAPILFAWPICFPVSINVIMGFRVL